ncbi:hypothetical protein F3Y22_tig00000778pilonHSYRG00161 [Hibiscus syriacus]|uniref:Uncharacterized protein n=1 Tax=Hibiscus syriacus TaxID=106335 RepID=A0A6A3D094_HIBSY|nr:hypothetical protein F3Y22_tig00000778pilonHSYRG00161 [Hibiscus syriacus]
MLFLLLSSSSYYYSSPRPPKILHLRTLLKRDFTLTLKSINQLSKRKLEMASIMAEKAREVNEFEDSSSKMISNDRYIEELRKEIEAANEEHVLVELAKIEALKEAADIKAQKDKKLVNFRI